MSDSVEAPRPELSGLQTGLLGLLFVARVGSIGARAGARTRATPSTGQPADAQGLVSNDGGERETAPPTPLERALPYVTECSFFGLIGFALGYASRKFVKLLLILLALFFLGLQALVWTGSVSVDWDGLLGKLDALLFNLKENESMTQFLTRRIPAGGGMLAGYLIGFRRG